MRFQPTLPVSLAEHLRELTDIALTAPRRELPTRPTERRVMATLMRIEEVLARRYPGSRATLEDLERIRTERDVAEALLALALGNPVPGCVAEEDRLPSHLADCPACRRHLEAVFATAVADLCAEDLPCRADVAAAYLARMAEEDGDAAGRAFHILALCGDRVVPLLAETAFQEGYALHQVTEHLGSVAPLVEGMQTALAAARAETDGPLADEDYKRIVDRFVAHVWMRGLRGTTKHQA